MQSIRWIATRMAVASLLVAAAAAVSLPAEERNSYTATYLVSDQAGVAALQDPSLVNAWGLTAAPTSPWWVADNGTDVSTLYRADGSKVPLTVDVRNAPTGAVANPGSNFQLTSGSTSVPARFIFSTEEGTILAWNPAISAAAVLAATGPGAIYKGLAVASTPGGDFLYATDFHNRRVDIYDGHFNPVTLDGAFVDRRIPDGYAPFGIQEVKGFIVVTYAKQDDEGEDDVPGQGHGFVDLFDTSGKLLARIAQHGQLNSPWGIALAPSDFGAFSNDLLIGNFGDGRINAFEVKREERRFEFGVRFHKGRDEAKEGGFEFAGQLRTAHHKRLVIDGLWALQFGKGSAANGPMTTLFFTAGPDDESHGLFGTIVSN